MRLPARSLQVTGQNPHREDGSRGDRHVLSGLLDDVDDGEERVLFNDEGVVDVHWIPFGGVSL